MLGIRGRLILTSTLLVAALVGALAYSATVESRRLIDQSATRLQMRTRDSLKRAADATLVSLVETSRIALMQSDYAMVQETIRNLARKDKLVTALAVVASNGTVLAHTDNKLVSKTFSAAELKKGAWHKGGDLITLSTPVSAGKRVLATVYLAYSKAPLAADLARSEKLKEKEARSVLTKTLAFGLMAVLLGVALTILQAVRITRPISEVAEKADQIAGGDLLARVDVNSKDELGLLADRFNYMAEQVTVLLEHAQQKAFLEQEIELASAVQATLVPSASIVDRPGASLAGHFQPASRCAGDWWNFYELSGDRTMLIVGDVTGHGVAAAMITAAAKGAVTTVVSSETDVTLQRVLSAMNSAIFEASSGQYVMTCFATIWDPKTRRLDYANAGHIFPAYVSPRNGGRAAALVARGNRLGDVLDSVFEVKTREVAPGDVAVFFTDGITECVDKKGREFGARRLRDLVAGNADADAGHIRDVLVSESKSFCGRTLKLDDVTLIVAKFS
jgi:sigma-B regulation protein RsbU (phosphoserine phosphatase)